MPAQEKAMPKRDPYHQRAAVEPPQTHGVRREGLSRNEILIFLEIKSFVTCSTR
jgi:hypothetical protein